MIRVTRHVSITSLPKYRWRQLETPFDPSTSYAYLRFWEARTGRPLTLLLASHTVHGDVGAVVVEHVDARSSFFSDPAKIISSPAFSRGEAGSESAITFDSVGGALHPSLVVRSICSSDFLVTSALAAGERIDCMRQLLAELVQLGRDCGARSVAFVGVSTANALLRRVLAEADFHHALFSATTQLPVAQLAQEADFFLRFNSGKKRTSLRREARRFREHCGVTPVDTLRDPSTLALAEVAMLERHGRSRDLDAAIHDVNLMRHHLKDQFRGYAAVDSQGEIVAVTSYLMGQQSLVCMIYGAFKEHEARMYRAYPGLVVYFSVSLAISFKMDRVLLGYEGFSAKLLRGAHLEGRELWITTYDRLPGFLVRRLTTLDRTNSAYLATLVSPGCAETASRTRE